MKIILPAQNVAKILDKLNHQDLLFWQEFRQSGTLKRHERIHLGEKQFTCWKYDKTFNWSGTLREHEKIHTGEKSFACSKCDQSFTDKYHFACSKCDIKQKWTVNWERQRGSPWPLPSVTRHSMTMELWSKRKEKALKLTRRNWP